jgi:hypothetical protein
MQGELVQALLSRRTQICARWTALLHIERANTALAHPDTLIHLLDWTFDSIIQALELTLNRKTLAVVQASGARPDCPCGRNPYLYFFIAGEQAWLEALVFTQVAMPKLEAVARDQAVAELLNIVRTLARTEVEAFCSVCQYREAALSMKAAKIAALA